jgi:hypothetical protein
MGMDMTAPAIRSLAAGVAAGLLLATAAGCAAEDSDGPGLPAGGADVSLDVVTPGDGDTVTVPFEVSVDSDVELGRAADEMHHLHVWFGEDQDDFDLYESDTARISDAPNGETTMWVQVHTFDHQPASDPVGVSLAIEGGHDRPSRVGPGYGDY